MHNDKRILYALSAALPIGFLLVALLPGGLEKPVLALLCAAAALLVTLLIKKRTTLSIHHYSVAGLATLSAVLAILLLYLLGLRFGFARATTRTNVIYRYILPYTVIILASEQIRRVITAQRKTASTVLCYISLVIADVLMRTDGQVFTSHSRFMNFFGFVLLPAITGNLLYHYLCSRYGVLSVAPYRILLSLYSYVIPFSPLTPDAMEAFILLLLPLVVYLFIRALYEGRPFVISRRRIWVQRVLTVVLIVVLLLFVMLISCRFRYGMVVVATDSMTGAVNRGDAVIYEQYDGELIARGDILVFIKDNARVIHRVDSIRNINGELRYYTKGDINDSIDSGYITSSNIVGTVRLKVKYIGTPTLWVRELFR